MTLWDRWKKGFYAWEDATARHLEAVLRSPTVLRPTGLALKALTATKAATDGLAAGWWAAVGLPTRRDQERALHRINELESRLLDLEERLEERRAPAGRRRRSRSAPAS